jgi:uncharacterized protein (DUF2164 family)
MTHDEETKRTMVQRLGDWLARDVAEKEADLAKLMKANIVISFLTLCSVVGVEGARSVGVMLGLL